MHQFIFRIAILLFAVLAASASPAVDDAKVEDGFLPIFDGKTLDGWHAVPNDSAGDWTVVDGILSGRGSQKRQSYLVFDEEVDDFELRFDYRMRTDGNSGVEIRGQIDQSGKRPFEGYHADFGHVGIGPNVLGAWDFHFAQRKEPPCPLGTRLFIREDGLWESETIENAVTTSDIRARDWNSVRIVADGQHFLFFINDRLASEFTDKSKERPLERGVIGLQLHDQGMHVEFRNVRLKRAEAEPGLSELDQRFSEHVRPFLANHCLDCHSGDEPEAKLDLSGFSTANSVLSAHQTWDIILQRVEAKEMPPPESDPRPSDAQRVAVTEWIRAAREFEAHRSAGDPGPVLARRLSNAEYNYSIRDLTGVDIRPTKTFPVDPANAAGFDNSGESLSMSPALLSKFFEAARFVSEHLVLAPDGIAFAPHPVVTDTDRDRYCVKRIVRFYERQPTDLTDYFFAAWQYVRREAPEQDNVSIADFAISRQISPKYLSIVLDLLLDDAGSAGPIAALQSQWRELPADEKQIDDARSGCERMRDFVVGLRRKLQPTIPNLNIEGSSPGSQTFVLWKNRRYVAYRRSFDPGMLQSRDEASEDVDGDLIVPSDDIERARVEAAFERFCSVFPDAFYISERGRDYVDDKSKQMGERGRLLSAGFHSMMGYFRDDAPLYELILDEEQQHEIDTLWNELNLIASAPQRQYSGFLWFERTDSRFMRDEQFDFARAESKEALTEPLVERLAQEYLAKAKAVGAGPTELDAIEFFFGEINEQMRWVERTRRAAEPRHLAAIVELAENAFRRPLTQIEREELVSFYRSLRDTDGLSHEEAIQDTLVSVLMSPHFCYRLDLGGDGSGRQPLTDPELASRLSYFLWASLPDAQLLHAAESGTLHQPEVLAAQTQRMLRDERVRGLATEFGGNWLDFRRFEEHNAVDRERFLTFTDELRQAMFEEPVRFIVDVARNDRPVIEFLDGDHTFVNRTLAEHYGISSSRLPDSTPSAAAGTPQDPGPSEQDLWFRLDNASAYERGGLLPMSVFLTQNAPGLRTSPVKRGYWVVRRLLGERIPPPPPNVPELPADESKLGNLTLRETLAVHRDNASCAGCHERFDSIGLAFEGFGPIGERRDVDLGGRPVDTTAAFPGGGEGTGVRDLRTYLRNHRQDEFLDNLCRKLLSYALSRSLILPDELLIRDMKANLAANNFRFSSLIETIVTSPQFLNRRATSP